MTRRFVFTLVLLACLAVGLICVAYPIYVIRPFRHQGAGELAVALAVTPIPAGDHGCRGDRGGSGGDRILARRGAEVEAGFDGGRRGAGGGAGVSGAGECLRADVPPAESILPSRRRTKSSWMGPRRWLRYESAERRARIRSASMSYHHIVNDVVGGAAIVATY